LLLWKEQNKVGAEHRHASLYATLCTGKRKNETVPTHIIIDFTFESMLKRYHVTMLITLNLGNQVLIKLTWTKMVND